MLLLKVIKDLANFHIRCMNNSVFMTNKPKIVQCKIINVAKHRKINLADVDVNTPRKCNCSASEPSHSNCVNFDGLFSVITENVQVKPDQVTPRFITLNGGENENCELNIINICAEVQDKSSSLEPVECTILDVEIRFECKDKPVFLYLGASNFSLHTVVPDIHLFKLNPQASSDKFSILGCEISPDITAINTVKAEKGRKCIVFGLGGIGLACILGCKALGASKIYGIDTNAEKCELAQIFGMTDFINTRDQVGSQKHLHQVEVMRQAWESTYIGWGFSVIIGLDDTKKRICRRPWILVVGISWKGLPYGSCHLKDISQLIENYLCNNSILDEFLPRQLQFQQIKGLFTNIFSMIGLRSVFYISDEPKF